LLALRWCSPPVCEAYMPVMIVFRDGAHTGDVEKAFV
jgi:hypothetical protein